MTTLSFGDITGFKTVVSDLSDGRRGVGEAKEIHGCEGDNIKKDVHMAMCSNSNEANKSRYNSMKNKGQ